MSIANSVLIAQSDIKRIVQGEQVRMTVELLDKITGEALNLEDIESITASFQGVDDAIDVTGSVVPNEAGRVTFLLTSVNTNLLMPGDSRSWEISLEFDDADDTSRIVQLVEELDVVERLF